MANLTGTDTYQKQVSTNPAAKPNGQTVSGELVEIIGIYTCTGAEVSGDVLPFFRIPVGAFMRDLWVTAEAIGGTTVVFTEFGDLGDTDRYSTTDIALTAGITESRWTLTNARALAPFAVTAGDAQAITGTITHAGAPTAGKMIVVRGIYRMP